MVYRRILEWPEKSLNFPSRDLDLQKDSQVIRDLIDTFKVSGGYGLSAPQIGLNVRAIAVNEKLLNKDNSGLELLLMINPKILNFKDNKKFEEACFSLPNISLEVSRFKEVEVEWLNSDGTKNRKWFKDYGSACVQHEIDHLDGILTVDKISHLRKSRLIKKIKKYKIEKTLSNTSDTQAKEEKSKAKSLKTRKKKRSIRKAKKK